MHISNLLSTNIPTLMRSNIWFLHTASPVIQRASCWEQGFRHIVPLHYDGRSPLFSSTTPPSFHNMRQPSVHATFYYLEEVSGSGKDDSAGRDASGEASRGGLGGRGRGSSRRRRGAGGGPRRRRRSRGGGGGRSRGGTRSRGSSRGDSGGGRSRRRRRSRRGRGRSRGDGLLSRGGSCGRLGGRSGRRRGGSSGRRGGLGLGAAHLADRVDAGSDGVGAAGVVDAHAGDALVREGDELGLRGGQ